MRIGIDLDDTITRTNCLAIEYAIKYDKEKFNGNGPKHIEIFKFDDMFEWPEGEKQLFFNKYLKEILENVSLLPNAKEYINRLYDEGYEIYIVTARNNKYVKESLDELTIDYLNKKGIKYHKLITNAKPKGNTCYNNHIELMIDDAMENLDDCNKYGIPVIQMEHFYNINDNKYLKVKNWEELYKKIKETTNGRENNNK